LNDGDENRRPLGVDFVFGIVGYADQYGLLTQVEQACVLQVLQLGPPPATTRPSLCAANSEIARAV